MNDEHFFFCKSLLFLWMNTGQYYLIILIQFNLMVRLMKHLGLISGGLFLIAAGAHSQERNPAHPNIVYVFPDQFRNDACGFWNQAEFNTYRKVKADPTITPNLNQFARESLVLTSAQSNNPVSSPIGQCLWRECIRLNKMEFLLTVIRILLRAV